MPKGEKNEYQEFLALKAENELVQRSKTISPLIKQREAARFLRWLNKGLKPEGGK